MLSYEIIVKHSLWNISSREHAVKRPRTSRLRKRVSGFQRLLMNSLQSSMICEPLELRELLPFKEIAFLRTRPPVATAFDAPRIERPSALDPAAAIRAFVFTEQMDKEMTERRGTSK